MSVLIGILVVILEIIMWISGIIGVAGVLCSIAELVEKTDKREAKRSLVISVRWLLYCLVAKIAVVVFHFCFQ